jgi:hypothetical protein
MDFTDSRSVGSRFGGTVIVNHEREERTLPAEQTEARGLIAL